MIIDKEAYIEEVRDMFNHICLLHDSELVRCIGFAEDALDFYYIVKDKFGKLSFGTFVGACISLKDSYERYGQLENIFNLNGCPPEEEFIIKKFSDLDNWKTYKIKTIDGEVDEPWMEKYYELRNALHEHLDELDE